MGLIAHRGTTDRRPARPGMRRPAGPPWSAIALCCLLVPAVGRPADVPSVAVDEAAQRVLAQVGDFYVRQSALQTTVALQATFLGGGLTSLPANLDKAVRQRRLNPAIVEMLPADIKAQLQAGGPAPNRLEGTATLAFDRRQGRLALVAPRTTLGDVVWDGQTVLEHLPGPREVLLRDAATPADVLREPTRARWPLLYPLALLLDGDAPRRLAQPDHFRRIDYLDKTTPKPPLGYWHRLRYTAGPVSMQLYFEADGDPWLRRVELEGVRSQKMGLTVLALQPQGGAQKLFEDREHAQLTTRLVYQFGPWKTSPDERLFKLPKPRGANRVDAFTTPPLFDLPAMLEAAK